MKRLYTKLSTDRLHFETEDSFLKGSVEVDAEVVVEEYHGFFFDETTKKEKDYGLTFDE